MKLEIRWFRTRAQYIIKKQIILAITESSFAGFILGQSLNSI